MLLHRHSKGFAAISCQSAALLGKLAPHAKRTLLFVILIKPGSVSGKVAKSSLTWTT